MPGIGWASPQEGGPNKMDIQYRNDIIPETDAVIALYRDAGLNRPINDRQRIARMSANSDLIVTAWQGDQLVGVARSLTDFCYCCYLSDLAVASHLQRGGIGKELVRLTKEYIGPQSMLLLLSAPTAMEYYPKIGMETVENGFMIRRNE